MNPIVIIGLITILSTVSIIYSAESNPFKHPGVLVSSAQLDLVKTKTKATSDPWQTAYKEMLKSKFASLSYEAKPRKMVECGSSSNPNYGCSDERNDAIAAFTHALIWYYTANKTHANKAIEIMDAWSATISGHNNSNAPLQTGWSGAVWPRAGDIIKHTAANWSADRAKRFETMLRDVYLPVVRKGSSSNGNWELTMIEATGAIAVFLDDHAAFNEALSMWRKRVPAYMYLKSDGDLPVAPPTGNKDTKAKLIEYWQGQTTFVDGLAQETCRDFGHAEWGIAAAVNMAETAWHQGVDLYKEGRERIVKAMEFHANYVLGASVPAWLCDGHIDTANTYPMWEIAYNHYHNRMAANMPKTNQLITKLRPTGTDAHFLAWETLTHANNPNN